MENVMIHVQDTRSPLYKIRIAGAQTTHRQMQARQSPAALLALGIHLRTVAISRRAYSDTLLWAQPHPVLREAQPHRVVRLKLRIQVLPSQRSVLNPNSLPLKDL